MASEEKKERLMTVPLRYPHKQPRTRRAEYAIKEIRLFVGQHMKCDAKKVWVAPEVNEAIWARGIQKPPTKLKVKVEKWPDGAVEVSIPEK